MCLRKITNATDIITHIVLIFSISMGLGIFYLVSSAIGLAMAQTTQIITGKPLATASLNRSLLAIGEQAQLQVAVQLQQAQGSPEMAVQTWPNWTDTTLLNGLEIVKTNPVRDSLLSVANKMQYQTVYITAWDSGNYTVPPLPIIVKQGSATQTYYTDSLTLRVNLVTVNPQQDIMPNKGNLEVAFSWRELIPYWPFLALLFVLLVLFWWYYKYKKRKKNKLPVITDQDKQIEPRPAHEIALKKLNELAQAKLWQQGKVKAYYSELSFIVREYLENRYQIPALEAVTTDILKQAATLDFKDAIATQYLSEILKTADLVKFAKLSPNPETHETLLINAEWLVQHTKLTANDGL
ncbi:MAG: hypothetical protein IPI59_05995 [Sphingobacteriales bacterium]|jgi:hypothetical protein|nr:hypothetical protein [Sphingobacteriales bacterium]MBP9141541.1 hypothetical protein [Chitinophagales bacterium]MCC7058443.1 hypothetical protein [Chitinophagales bacterium]MDA0198386.1 BatD family protein [Bacteroidota bacterium]